MMRNLRSALVILLVCCVCGSTDAFMWGLFSSEDTGSPQAQEKAIPVSRRETENQLGEEIEDEVEHEIEAIDNENDFEENSMDRFQLDRDKRSLDHDGAEKYIMDLNMEDFDMDFDHGEHSNVFQRMKRSDDLFDMEDLDLGDIDMGDIDDSEFDLNDLGMDMESLGLDEDILDDTNESYETDKEDFEEPAEEEDDIGESEADDQIDTEDKGELEDVPDADEDYADGERRRGGFVPSQIRRGQDISASQRRRGQGISASQKRQGQGISASQKRRGQGVSASQKRRGQAHAGSPRTGSIFVPQRWANQKSNNQNLEQTCDQRSGKCINLEFLAKKQRQKNKRRKFGKKSKTRKGRKNTKGRRNKKTQQQSQRGQLRRGRNRNTSARRGRNRYRSGTSRAARRRGRRDVLDDLNLGDLGLDLGNVEEDFDVDDFITDVNDINIPTVPAEEDIFTQQAPPQADNEIPKDSSNAARDNALDSRFAKESNPKTNSKTKPFNPGPNDADLAAIFKKGRKYAAAKEKNTQNVEDVSNINKPETSENGKSLVRRPDYSNLLKDGRENAVPKDKDSKSTKSKGRYPDSMTDLVKKAKEAALQKEKQFLQRKQKDSAKTKKLDQKKRNRNKSGKIQAKKHYQAHLKIPYWMRRRKGGRYRYHSRGRGRRSILDNLGLDNLEAELEEEDFDIDDFLSDVGDGEVPQTDTEEDIPEPIEITPIRSRANNADLAALFTKAKKHSSARKGNSKSSDDQSHLGPNNSNLAALLKTKKLERKTSNNEAIHSNSAADAMMAAMKKAAALAKNKRKKISINKPIKEKSHQPDKLNEFKSTGNPVLDGMIQKARQQHLERQKIRERFPVSRKKTSKPITAQKRFNMRYPSLSKRLQKLRDTKLGKSYEKYKPLFRNRADFQVNHRLRDLMKKFTRPARSVDEEIEGEPDVSSFSVKEEVDIFGDGEHIEAARRSLRDVDDRYEYDDDDDDDDEEEEDEETDYEEEEMDDGDHDDDHDDEEEEEDDDEDEEFHDENLGKTHGYRASHANKHEKNVPHHRGGSPKQNLGDRDGHEIVKDHTNGQSGDTRGHSNQAPPLQQVQATSEQKLSNLLADALVKYSKMATSNTKPANDTNKEKLDNKPVENNNKPAPNANSAAEKNSNKPVENSNKPVVNSNKNNPDDKKSEDRPNKVKTSKEHPDNTPEAGDKAKTDKKEEIKVVAEKEKSDKNTSTAKPKS